MAAELARHSRDVDYVMQETEEHRDMESLYPGEGDDLRHLFDQLLAQARENEQKLQRFNELELKLIASASLPELVERILLELPSVFRLDKVTLTLVDPDQELKRMLESKGLGHRQLPEVLFTNDTAQLSRAYPEEDSPFLGIFSADQHRLFFPSSRAAPASLALLPLKRGTDLIGSLNLGSLDPNRYSPGSRTDFLERLAAIVAVCIENGANHERLKQIGMTDALTGISNRRYFDERLIEEIAASKRRGQPLACIFLDVDHFKKFNDRYGHQAGDVVLREVAEQIRLQIRRSDVLSRYGGEEFVLLMPNATRRAARETAERIRQTVAGRHYALDANPAARVTLSIGAAVFTAPEDAEVHDVANALIRAADRAVYQAKATGRNRVVLSGATGAPEAQSG